MLTLYVFLTFQYLILMQYEKLKQYGADDIIVISNTYLIKNYILLSDSFEEL